jgi:hypothetical protein
MPAGPREAKLGCCSRHDIRASGDLFRAVLGGHKEANARLVGRDRWKRLYASVQPLPLQPVGKRYAQVLGAEYDGYDPASAAPNLHSSCRAPRSCAPFLCRRRRRSSPSLPAASSILRVMPAVMAGSRAKENTPLLDNPAATGTAQQKNECAPSTQDLGAVGFCDRPNAIEGAEIAVGAEHPLGAHKDAGCSRRDLLENRFEMIGIVMLEIR